MSVVFSDFILFVFIAAALRSGSHLLGVRLNFMNIIIGHLSSIGLVFDIIGAILLFVFGLSHLVTLDGSVILTARLDTKEEEIKNISDAKSRLCLSRIALDLIVVGFLFQLIGNLNSNAGNTKAPNGQKQIQD